MLGLRLAEAQRWCCVSLGVWFAQEGGLDRTFSFSQTKPLVGSFFLVSRQRRKSNRPVWCVLRMCACFLTAKCLSFSFSFFIFFLPLKISDKEEWVFAALSGRSSRPPSSLWALLCCGVPLTRRTKPHPWARFAKKKKKKKFEVGFPPYFLFSLFLLERENGLPLRCLWHLFCWFLDGPVRLFRREGLFASLKKSFEC
jgi:hypothetical protein